MTDILIFLNKPYIFLASIIVLDLVLGDPIYRLHPVRLFGDTLTCFEKCLRKLKLDNYIGGVLLFFLLVLVIGGFILGIHHFLFFISPWLSYLWYLYIGYSLIAIRDLCLHGKRIAQATENDNLESARFHTSMLVSRDVDHMDLKACNRAGIESLSENLTDGILSPIFFFIILGIPGLVLFKIISTMDSMIGYKTEKYLKLGWCGARLDDVMNFIPARLSWIIISLTSLLLPNCSAFSAFKVGWQQHHTVSSPNSGWSELTAAGALKIKLGGPIWRNDKLASENWLGDPSHQEGAEARHIYQMIQLVYLSTILYSIMIILLNILFLRLI